MQRIFQLDDKDRRLLEIFADYASISIQILLDARRAHHAEVVVKELLTKMMDAFSGYTEYATRVIAFRDGLVRSDGPVTHRRDAAI